MGRLSTHVLDTASGHPAEGMRIDLHRVDEGGAAIHVVTAITDTDGRTGGLLVAGDAMRAGTYRLAFHVGEYFDAQGTPGARQFLRVVPVEFVIDDPDANYHVPLLVTPWSYSTYRGS